MTDTSIPRDGADLKARIDAAWTALLATVEPLTAEQMSRHSAGAWSVKDNLAHLAEWEQFMLGYHLRGEPPHAVMQMDRATFEQLDEDGINAVLYNRNKDRPAAEVLEGLKRSHAQVMSVLQQTSFADLMKPHFPDDPQRRPLLNWVAGNTYEHYAEHRAGIEKIILMTGRAD